MRSPVRLAVVIATAALLAACGGGQIIPTGPTNATSVSIPDPSTATSLTYTSNIAPILQSDCVMCHNSSVRSGGYDLSTYSAVMRTVTPGNANSLLVRVTQPGGVMYSTMGSSATNAAATIRRWVVDFNAAQ